MTEKNMKDIKLPDLSYLKSSVESYNKLNVDSMTIQDPKTLVNPQTENDD